LKIFQQFLTYTMAFSRSVVGAVPMEEEEEEEEKVLRCRVNFRGHFARSKKAYEAGNMVHSCMHFGTEWRAIMFTSRPLHCDRNSPHTHCTKGLLGPRANPDMVAKSKLLATNGNQTLAIKDHMQS
jgi:hypothetical protein